MNGNEYRKILIDILIRQKKIITCITRIDGWHTKKNHEEDIWNIYEDIRRLEQQMVKPSEEKTGSLAQDLYRPQDKEWHEP